MNRIKKLLIFIAALLFATALVGAKIYWTRNIQHTINVVGVEAELIEPGCEGYDQKIVTTQLIDDKVGLVIVQENFYDLWLNISWTSDAEDLACEMTGQYYDVYWHWHSPEIGHTPVFTPLDTPFIISNTESIVIDKTKMMLVPLTKPSYADGSHGYCLVIHFNWDTEFILLPGDYTINILFQMGFV